MKKGCLFTQFYQKVTPNNNFMYDVLSKIMSIENVYILFMNYLRQHPVN